MASQSDSPSMHCISYGDFLFFCSQILAELPETLCVAGPMSANVTAGSGLALLLKVQEQLQRDCKLYKGDTKIKP